ncbi:enoyl-CoA hydratase/isomerase family protein [Streptomyces olivaceus]|uniref:enoyl-CoA hydratase/isomerase family protein n=1 Tax=Streptomyces olivaceus TaxID=47716 RepID=UPI001CCB68A6|nr:enoyl-CoA hydratase/isomerase family protein [Streptomyces olivaceus]MBZ6080152.1 enoyl-CoA hydratase/isomerase family protein [Streptomyces olivaceus]MBZ6285659.1 enoyl-CoA hydratase/isomerase family protein [Streptomyces olivaceus]
MADAEAPGTDTPGAGTSDAATPGAGTPDAETVRVRCDVADGVARVRLARPRARNAVDLEMCLRLRDVFEDLDADDDVRVVLLSAEGPAFCAGADLKERAGRDAAWVRRRRQASFAAYDAVERCRRPVVALVHGAVVGSGGEITLAADFAVAAEDTTFRFPEAHWGTVGATQRLQRVIGRRRAKELLFTNRVMPADEAADLGVVTRVVPGDRLARAGEEIAASIAGAPPLAMALTKRAVDLGGETDLDRGIRIEMAAIEQCLADGGWREGVDRFARRRDGGRGGTGGPGGTDGAGSTDGHGGTDGHGSTEEEEK